MNKENNTVDDWAVLREKRLLRYDDSHLLQFLRKMKTTRNLGYKTVQVDVHSCHRFEDVAKRFGESFSFPQWFGENEDALFDLLNDLPSGKYIVEIKGSSSLNKSVLSKLRMVLSQKREGGSGYGDGEAIFIMN